MELRELPGTSFYLDLVAAFLFGFAAFALAPILFRAPPEQDGLLLLAALTATLVGVLAAGLLWRREAKNSPRTARQGGACGAAFAVAAVVMLHFLRPDFLGPLPPLWCLGACAVAWALAGATTASVFHRNVLKCGHIAAAFIVGAALAGTQLLPRFGDLQPDALVLLAGGAAAAGAFLISLRREGVGACVAAVAALAMAASTPLLKWLDWSLPWLALQEQRWAISSMEAVEVSTAVVWSGGVLALVAPLLFLQPQARDQRSGLARLWLIVLLWVPAAFLVTWQPIHLLMARSADLASGRPELWIALGVALGAIAVDAWPVALQSLERAFVGGAVGAAGAVIIGHGMGALGWTTAGSSALIIALALLVPLLLTLVVAAAARTAAVVGAVHSVWLWACVGLSTAALAAYGSASALRAVSESLLPSAGLLLACGSYVVAADIRIWRDSARAIRRWFEREWRAKGFADEFARATTGAQDYPTWLLVLRSVTYLGYAPWWIAATLMRIAWAGIYAVGATTAGVVGGLLESAFGLILGKRAPSLAQRVVLRQEAPVVSLSPAEEQAPRRQLDKPSARARKGLTLGEIASLPLLQIMAGMDRVQQVASSLAQGVARRVLPARRPPRPWTAAEGQPETETLVLGPPPEVVPGHAATLDSMRQGTLRRRSTDSAWRRFLRGAIGGRFSRGIQEWLAPDTAEPWDDRVFRAEMIGPRGRRFELYGHLWASRRRRGGVVTIPILSGHADKTVEVRARDRDVRALLENDPEQLKAMLLRAAYRMAVRDLTAGLQGSRTVTCESCRQDLIEPHQDRQCELREELPTGGHRCRQPLAQDRARGGTTLAACAGCNFPEIWMRCNELKLEGTIGTVEENDVTQRRAHMMCRVTQKIVDVGECLHLDCFSPTVITRIIEIEVQRTR